MTVMRGVWCLSVIAFTMALGTTFADITEQSPPIPLANVEGEPSSFFNGTVSVISGDFCDSEDDIAIPGPEAMVLRRFYSSSSAHDAQSILHGWDYNHQPAMIASYNPFTKKMTVLMNESSGARMTYDKTFRSSNRIELTATFDCSKPCQGLTNCGGGAISGRSNLKNASITFGPKRKECVADLGSGGRRHYTTEWWRSTRDRDPSLFLLADVSHPSGNKTIYRYAKDNAGTHLHTVTNTDAAGKLTFNDLTYEIPLSRKAWVKDPHLSIVGSDGSSVRYDYEVVKKKKEGFTSYLKKVSRTNGPTIEYAYDKKGYWQARRLVRKDLPDGRYLATDYYTGKANDVNGTIVTIPSDDPRVGRVKTQWAPVGTDSTAVCIGKFFYSTSKGEQGRLGAGTTDVYDALNTLSRYHYDKGLRLGAIERFDANKNIVNIERFGWGAEGVAEVGNLLWRSFGDATGRLLSFRRLAYDNNGNISIDTLYGDLTGKGGPLPSSAPDGTPLDNGCDSDWTAYSYSNDSFNLVTSERHSNGQIIHYGYKAGTSLLTVKFTCDGNGILIREFYDYDDTGVLIRTVVDDGTSYVSVDDLSGVTERHITVITPTTTAPLGLPAIEEERYWDPLSGHEVLLKRTIRRFSQQGWPVEETLYDADEREVYSVNREYDAHGNIVRESDPCGAVIERVFDANGNLIEETGPRPGHKRRQWFDYSNRLIREELTSDDGARIVQTHRYDYLGRLVASVDAIGNETTATYDALGNRLQVTGGAEGTMSSTYDAAGRATTITDALGNTCTCRYNARGQLTEKVFPDGTRERQEYDVRGQTVAKTATNGATTRFTYDSLDRPLTEDLIAADGELLARTENVYSGFHRTAAIDAEGNTTRFFYDPAGRLSEERRGDESNYVVTSFQYDSLGRVAQTIHGQGDDCSISAQKYDSCNRVIEESTHNSSGDLQRKTQYRYDEAGNKTAVIVYRDGSPDITLTTYTVDGQPERVEDAFGNVTIFEYDRNHIDDNGDVVLQRRITDPRGIQNVLTEDRFGREHIREVRDAFGEQLSKTVFDYDRAGRRIRQTVTADDGEAREQRITEWVYDACGRVITLREAVDSDVQRITSIAYNNLGQKQSLFKADGTVISTLYDKAGRVSEQRASDGSVHYRYSYDRNNQLVCCEDNVAATMTLRCYDCCLHLVEETQSNDLTKHYAYDTAGREKEFRIHDGSTVYRDYDGIEIQTVTRRGADGEERYRHQIEAVALDGSIVREKSAGNSGISEYSHDQLGRLSEIKSKHYHQILDSNAYDAAGRLLAAGTEDPIGLVDSGFDYDDLGQLIVEGGMACHRYGYDSAYNRRSKDGVGYEDNALNQVLSDGTSRYRFDANGNLVEEERGGQKWTYRYDALDRLVAVDSSAGDHVSYGYDFDNRRVYKQIGQETEQYLYDGKNEVGVVDDANKLIAFRVLLSGHGAEIGAAVAIELKANVYVPVHDHRGNVVVMVDSADGAVAETYRYSAFGEEQIFGPLNSELTTSRLQNPWRYQSKHVDDETGWVFFGRRYYSPQLGRWTTCDPKGYDEGPNLYAYLSNRPLTLWDLYGLEQVGLFARYKESLFNDVRSAMGQAFTMARTADQTALAAAQLMAPRLGNRSTSGSLGRSLELPNARIYAATGMLNSLDECISFAKTISDFHGGHNVRYIYNSSHGLPGDVLEAASGVLGASSHSARLMADSLRSGLNEMGEDGRIIQYLSSQSTIDARHALKLLKPEERKRIEMVACGPAQCIGDKECGKAVNYISTGDLVPWIADNPSLRVDADVRFLKPEGGWRFEHSVNCPTYQKVWKRRGEKFMMRYGL